VVVGTGREYTPGRHDAELAEKRVLFDDRQPDFPRRIL